MKYQNCLIDKDSQQGFPQTETCEYVNCLQTNFKCFKIEHKAHRTQYVSTHHIIYFSFT